jgi:hypothetical protein
MTERTTKTPRKVCGSTDLWTHDNGQHEAHFSALQEPPDYTTSPETICRRCGGPNVWSWHAPSPVWNAVMRADDDLEHNGLSIICPPCFADLAEGKGFPRAIWHFAPHDWETRLPLVDGEGRWWDFTRCLWVAP